MSRKNDEYNYVKIVNEDENVSFEFGSTPSSESTSFKDNHDQLHDEVNDNPISNDENKSSKKEERRKKEEQKQENNNSSKGSKGGSHSGGHSAVTGGSIATVVGAALVSVATLSTLVGINLFFSGRCVMNRFEVQEESVVYELELTDIGDHNCVIQLENSALKYLEQQELVEGPNEGNFSELTAGTSYHLSVIDLSYSNYVLYSKNFKTLGGDTPTPGMCTISFDANGGSGEMDNIVVEKGTKMYLPDCTFEAPELHKKFNDRWHKDSPDGTAVPTTWELTINSDMVFYADWADCLVATIENRGGTGSMDPVKFFSPECEAPECTLTPPENFKFDYWMVVDQPAEAHYQPGQKIMATEDITIFPNWTPEASLLFSVQYIDTRGDSPSNVIAYNYTLEDEHSMFENFLMYFYPNSGSSFSIELTFEVGQNLEYYASLGDYANKFDYDEITYDYTIVGIYDGDEYDLATGSLASKESQKSYFSSVYVGPMMLNDGGSLYYIIINGVAYLPLLINMRDYKNQTYGELTIEYTIENQTRSFNYTHTGGMGYYPIEAPTTSTAFTMYDFKVKDMTGNNLFTCSNLSCDVFAEGSYSFYGFNVNLDFENPTLTTTLVGMGATGGTFADMGYSNYRLVFTAKSKDGYVYDMNYEVIIEVPLTVNDTDSITDEITAQFETEDYQKLMKFINRYMFDVELKFYDPSYGDRTVKSYSNYTFR